MDVGRSFFSPEFGTASLGGGAQCWKGFYQSVRPTQAELTLNLGAPPSRAAAPPPPATHWGITWTAGHALAAVVYCWHALAAVAYCWHALAAVVYCWYALAVLVYCWACTGGYRALLGTQWRLSRTIGHTLAVFVYFWTCTMMEAAILVQEFFLQQDRCGCYSWTEPLC